MAHTAPPGYDSNHQALLELIGFALANRKKKKTTSSRPAALPLNWQHDPAADHAAEIEADRRKEGRRATARREISRRKAAVR
jgi:hypothetical protein